MKQKTRVSERELSLCDVVPTQTPVAFPKASTVKDLKGELEIPANAAAACRKLFRTKISVAESRSKKLSKFSDFNFLN